MKRVSVPGPGPACHRKVRRLEKGGFGRCLGVCRGSSGRAQTTPRAMPESRVAARLPRRLPSYPEREREERGRCDERGRPGSSRGFARHGARVQGEHENDGEGWEEAVGSELGGALRFEPASQPASRRASAEPARRDTVELQAITDATPARWIVRRPQSIGRRRRAAPGAGRVG